ncbi:MAG: phosphatase PAP2 family protein [Ignavibacteriaceae bacterium]|nr:phosphatase PAP2 family protein [Ignavibacteriaceae bacterium]
MIDFFYSIDLSVFYFINHSLSVPFLDKFFSIITDVTKWYIAYVILLGILFFKGGKRGKIAFFGIILLIIVSDQLGHRVLKEYFQRIRPCNLLTDAITPLGSIGGWSFPSNHAANNFAAATFFSKLFPKYTWLLFVVASLIALSRVYLGLHYPSDILGGALVGFVLGYIFSLGVIKSENLFSKKKSK